MDWGLMKSLLFKPDPGGGCPLSCGYRQSQSMEMMFSFPPTLTKALNLQVVSPIWEGAAYPLSGNTTEKSLWKDWLLFVSFKEKSPNLRIIKFWSLIPNILLILKKSSSEVINIIKWDGDQSIVWSVSSLWGIRDNVKNQTALHLLSHSALIWKGGS